MQNLDILFMKINLLKRMTFAVVTLSTASFYFAQETEPETSLTKELDQVVLVGVTDIAKDRKTPVAVSNVKASRIAERLGNQELPEILNTTPSVYATKSSGGFGESGLVIRGFESSNIAVMVNGMPVNDMEGGKVYFSNWTGLSDVTSAVQVQRGLGASKLAIASVGGTVNFVIRSSDMKKGGSIKVGLANDNVVKSTFSYNTGKSKNGWSSSILMSRNVGETYIENTDYESYSYLFGLGYQPNKSHNFQFTITTAPQWHDKRNYAPTLESYIKYNPDHDGTPYRRYNSDFGYYTDVNGKRRVIASRANFYSKPVIMLNWDWKMNEKSKLSTLLYASNGRGGGLGESGKLNGKFSSGYLDKTGHIDYNQIWGHQGGISRVISSNAHDWYGTLINFQHKIDDNLSFSIGTDDRYYKGYHYQILSDLYGGTSYSDKKNFNLLPSAHVVTKTYDYKKLPWNPFGEKVASEKDRIGYSNVGEVLWYSLFGQVEYSKNSFSAFLQGSASNQAYQRIDQFVKDGVTVQQGQIVHTKTGFKDIFGFNVKGGANYNIDSRNNVFVNLGYYSKQPFFNAVYPSNQQVLNHSLTNEKIFSSEIGYGLRLSDFQANVNLYRTEWKDRWLRLGNVQHKANGQDVKGYAEINGIMQIHMGAEVDASYRPASFLELQGMFSIGDFRYKGNPTGVAFDENNNLLRIEGKDATVLYLDKVKVSGTGNSSIPQMTASLGATVKPVSDLSIYGTWRYVGQLYSSIDINSFRSAAAQDRGVLRLPDYNLLDLGLSYKIRLENRSQYFTISGNVYNVLDTTYISDGATNIFAGDRGAKGETYKGIDKANRVYFGYGRTWSAGIAFNF